MLINWFNWTLLLAALIVLLPLHLEALGFGVDGIAAVTAAAGVGGVLSADFVGGLASRIGPVRLVRFGLLAMGASVAGIGAVSQLIPMLVLNTIVGVCTSMIRVGSQMLVRNRVDDDRRGRVHARQGQTTRLTMLVVPVGVGVMWEVLGPLANFAIPALITVVTLALAGSLTIRPPARAAKGESMTPFTTMLRYASGPILFSAARAGRMLLLPLIGLELNLSPPRIGLLIGLTSAADLLISPISGPIMDSRGRLGTIIPSFALTAVGFIILGLASGGWLLGVAAVVLGLGNGFSAGLLLTLGTDLAPAGNEGAFLGRFGAMHDSGRLLGPFLVGLLGESLGLNAAAIALAVVCFIGLACILAFVGETRPPTKNSADRNMR